MPLLSQMLTVKYSEKVTDKTHVPPPDWEALVAQIADDVMAEHSPARLLQVRAKLYDLLSHCIPPTTVLKVDRLFLLSIRLNLLIREDVDLQTHTKDR